MHIKVWSRMWKEQTNGADEFETKEDFITYIEKRDIDTAFDEEVDADRNKIEQ